MAIKYTNTFDCETLRNLPKIAVFSGHKIRHLATLLKTLPQIVSPQVCPPVFVNFAAKVRIEKKHTS
jgi:hypothetical protein